MARAFPTGKLVQLGLLPAALTAVALGVGRPRPPARPEQVFAGTPPVAAIDLGTARALPPPATPGFDLTVIAELPDAAGAKTAAEAVRALLAASARFLESPDGAAARAALLDGSATAPATPPEVEALGRRGLTSAIGAGWPGKSADAERAVQLLGRLVVIDGLEVDRSGLRTNPLAALLAKAGARVAFEGDPAGAIGPVIELSCLAPTEADAARLAGALRGYLRAPGLLLLRPAWHPTAPTPAEASARATWAALATAVEEAVVGAAPAAGLPEDEAELAAQHHLLVQAAREAVEAWSQDPAADAVVVAAWRDAVERTLPLLPLVGELLDQVDPRVAGVARRALADLPLLQVGARRDLERQRVLSERLGRLGQQEPLLGASGDARAVGRRLELALRFHRLARGLPALLEWLRAARCADARLALVDEAPARRPR